MDVTPLAVFVIAILLIGVLSYIAMNYRYKITLRGIGNASRRDRDKSGENNISNKRT